ncbi:MAG TPA: PH domain-containing protein [Streptosporangiaceae bacterium]|nr:PH domain-containing protein [Streptosporangiaceae bacterium]
MAQPEQSSTTEGQVILSDHPHWTTLIATILLLIVTVAVAGVLIFFVPDTWGAQTQVRLGIAGAAVVIAFVFSIVPFLRWFATRYELTDQGLVIREGVLSRSVRTIPIGRINDAAHAQRLIERMLGKGTLTVESGGERGQLVLKNVPEVEEWHQQIYRLIDDVADGVRDGR